MNRQESKRRVLLCLALYLLFAFIPGLHAAMHPAVSGAPGPAQPLPVAEISAACPDGCENPEHRHLKGTHDCPVCKTGWSPAAIPPPLSQGFPATPPAVTLARGNGPGLRTPDILVEHARAPPRSLPL